MIDLNKLEKNLDEALAKETPESLNNFLNKERMTTNEKIAIWLNHEHIHEEIWMNPINHANYWIDFLHDRNQQKWIEDFLKKDGWAIGRFTNKLWKGTEIKKGNKKYQGDTYSDNDGDFIQAVEQLIDKENERTNNQI